MKQLVTGSAIAALMLTFLPTQIAPAANNTATTLFPLDGPNQLETHTFLNCFKSDGHCDFIAGPTCAHPTV
jgi:hypothetical protein